MKPDVMIYTGHDAVDHLVTFCQTLGGLPFTLVADTNTYRALGQQVEAALVGAGFKLTRIVLTGDEVIADGTYLLSTLVQSPPGDQVYIAVGTGTLTDIARYVSFRTRNPFISVPTAPSVDGFLSSGAPLVVGGVKETYKAQGPIAVFTDIQTAVDSPRALKAAGFGDMLGKFTSLADWRLGHLLWEEPYDPAIDQRTRQAVERCLTALDELTRSSESGVRTLMDALLESGLCMLEFGDSRPASGAEHHCSHYWELQLLKTGRKAILHGAKVGYASTLIAQLYGRIRQTSAQEIAQRLEQAELPDRDAEIEKIRRAYGAGAEDVIRVQRPFLDLTEEQYHHLKSRILEHWSEIQAIAATVPPAAQIAEPLERVGSPVRWQDLTFEEHEVADALAYGHYLRNRFTVIKLFQMCGLDPTEGLLK